MKQQQAYRIIAAALFIIMMGRGTAAFAQVKIGSNPTSLNSNAVLEMESGNKGLLLPRLALTSTISPAPMTAFVRGMVVYNTATVNDVVPGMYYSDGLKWMKMVAGAFAEAPPSTWSINGNGGTNAAFNFLGTTDNMALRFRTNNLERMTINPNGWVGIGTSTPTAALQIKGELVIDTLTAGNRGTDNILVAGAADGKVRSIPAAGFVSGAQKRVEIVAVGGQTVFNTPSPFTDANKILLYRNGIQISFTVNNSSSIVSEIPCMAGDEIRIIQLL